MTATCNKSPDINSALYRASVEHAQERAPDNRSSF
jgi:hypothetical protein